MQPHVGSQTPRKRVFSDRLPTSRSTGSGKRCNDGGTLSHIINVDSGDDETGDVAGKKEKYVEITDHLQGQSKLH